jgi:LacI family transcriptional regulator
VEQRLAGLVIRRFAHEAEIQALCDELRDYAIPVIFVDDDLATPGTRYVTSDDELGIRLVVQHLIDLGHRRIAYIAGDTRHKQSVLRREIFARVLAENGIEARQDWIVNTDHSRERAEAFTLQIFAEPAGTPTAALYDGDQLAAVGIRALARLGLRVPDDVSVAGYGGFSFAELYNPTITTVVQPFEEMGRVAVRHLLMHTDAKDKRGRDEQEQPAQPDFTPELLPTRLIPGESTAPPRA